MKKVLDTYSSKNDINIKQIVAYKDNILEIEEYRITEYLLFLGNESKITIRNLMNMNPALPDYLNQPQIYYVKESSFTTNFTTNR